MGAQKGALLFGVTVSPFSSFKPRHGCMLHTKLITFKVHPCRGENNQTYRNRVLQLLFVFLNILPTVQPGSHLHQWHKEQENKHDFKQAWHSSHTVLQKQKVIKVPVGSS